MRTLLSVYSIFNVEIAKIYTRIIPYIHSVVNAYVWSVEILSKKTEAFKKSPFSGNDMYRESICLSEYVSNYLNTNFVVPPFCFITILPKAFIFSVVIMLLDSTLFVSIA